MPLVDIARQLRGDLAHLGVAAGRIAAAATELPVTTGAGGQRATLCRGLMYFNAWSAKLIDAFVRKSHQPVDEDNGMTLTPSMMPPLGTAAPDFRLPDTENRIVSLNDFAAAPALLVIFMSHHCPYTRHILPALLKTVREYQSKGLAVIAINSNDPSQHAEDSPEHIARAAAEMNFVFRFLIDTTQNVAKAFQAACTPDFFVYDRNRKLAYRGRFDDSRPDNDTPVTGDQLRAALDAVLAETPATQHQKPSIGCNIKWKRGNEPAYFLEKRKQPA